jgi:UDP-N-acetylmuramoylalanine--D-glutamate ligase
MSGAFAGERAVVIGAGASGRAAARVLLEEGAADVRVSERADGAPDGVFAELGVPVLTGGHRPEHLEGATLVVTSPGVPRRSDIIRQATARGIRVWSELELGARLCRVPYVAVTGTNGKTTTTELIASCLRSAGVDAIACGNIGHPFSVAAREGRAALVVEASSFQLRFSESVHPTVSVLLNVAEDHLDWHGTWDDYVSAKARIHRLQHGADTHVGNRDDPRSADVSAQARCRLVWFRSSPPDDGEVGYVDGELVSRIGPPACLGHTAARRGGALAADAAAAAAAATAFGIGAAPIAAAIENFRPLAHRGQVVATVGDVRFVDDSKATNPHATLAALAGASDTVLIAGGLAKGVDLSVLAAAAPSLTGVVAIGAAADDLLRIFRELVPARRATSIEEAVRTAFDLAGGRGTILLAPACASQDMFSDYGERGDRFAAAASQLAGEAAHG